MPPCIRRLGHPSVPQERRRPRTRRPRAAARTPATVARPPPVVPSSHTRRGLAASRGSRCLARPRTPSHALAAAQSRACRPRTPSRPSRPVRRDGRANRYFACGTMSAQRVLPSILRASFAHLAVVQAPRLAVLHAHGHLALLRAVGAQIARLGEDGEPRPLPAALPLGLARVLPRARLGGLMPNSPSGSPRRFLQATSQEWQPVQYS